MWIISRTWNMSYWSWRDVVPLWNTLILETLDHVMPSVSFFCHPYYLSEVKGWFRLLGQSITCVFLLWIFFHSLLPGHYKSLYIADWLPYNMASEKLSHSLMTFKREMSMHSYYCPEGHIRSSLCPRYLLNSLVSLWRWWNVHSTIVSGRSRPLV